jgi:hypothetical protein
MKMGISTKKRIFILFPMPHNRNERLYDDCNAAQLALQRTLGIAPLSSSVRR